MIEFLKANYCLSDDEARIMSYVYMNTKDLDCIESSSFYFKHGKKRIYYGIWSQNNMSAIEGMQHCYFDLASERFYVVAVNYGLRIVSDITVSNFAYSGGKTKKRFMEMVEVAKNAKKIFG
jgi:hypothetical protein